MDDDELDFLAEVIHRAIQGNVVEVSCRTARETKFWFVHLVRTLDDIELPHDDRRQVGHQQVAIGSLGLRDGGVEFATLSDRTRRGSRSDMFLMAP